MPVRDPVIRFLAKTHSGKRAYAVVEVPDEVKTLKEANDYVWEKMKRAVEKGWIMLLPTIDIYQLEED